MLNYTKATETPSIPAPTHIIPSSGLNEENVDNAPKTAPDIEPFNAPSTILLPDSAFIPPKSAPASAPLAAFLSAQQRFSEHPAMYIGYIL